MAGSTNNRDDLLKAFISRGGKRRKGYRGSALPPMEGAFRAQSTPRVKRGSFRPVKRTY
jgi:hypothetical protein